MKSKEILNKIYGRNYEDWIFDELQLISSKYAGLLESEEFKLSEKDVVLITYGDQVSSNKKESKLQTLKKFADQYLKPEINSIHILPFYPYSSDDGFSVIDYFSVNPLLGDWDDIKTLSKDYRLMFDGVVNHISKKSEWFKKFLENDDEFESFFIEEDINKDFSKVVRPRVSPLLHEYEDLSGQKKFIWTTFSEDQVDLNYKNPKVLLKVIELLLFYASKGAKLIRLDAIGYLWKKDNTECIHLPQAHQVIKLIRAIFDGLMPSVSIITETNVPHNDNVSYFGNGLDEARMVYNFTLPPLIAYSLLTANSAKLTQWASNLELPSNKVCFFNFTASHDGVGLNPVASILSKEEIKVIINSAKHNNGNISYKTNEDGTESPYEINCNYFDILKGIDNDNEIGIQRMIISQAIMLAFPGVPGVYFHSLVGSENYVEGVETTGRYRSINREKLNFENLVEELSDKGSTRNKLYTSYKKLLEIRTTEPAFNPFGHYSFPRYGDGIFAIKREAVEGKSRLLLLFNLANEEEIVNLNGKNYVDLLSGVKFDKEFTLKAMQFYWLKEIYD